MAETAVEPQAMRTEGLADRGREVCLSATFRISVAFGLLLAVLTAARHGGLVSAMTMVGMIMVGLCLLHRFDRYPPF